MHFKQFLEKDVMLKIQNNEYFKDIMNKQQIGIVRLNEKCKIHF